MSALLDLTHWVETTEGTFERIPERVRSELHDRILAVYKEGYADGYEVTIGALSRFTRSSMEHVLDLPRPAPFLNKEAQPTGRMPNVSVSANATTLMALEDTEPNLQSKQHSLSPSSGPTESSRQYESPFPSATQSDADEMSDDDERLPREKEINDRASSDEGHVQSRTAYTECSKTTKDARGLGIKRPRLEVESSDHEGDMEDNTVKGAEYMDTWIVVCR
ncbi:hypothetical protein BKA80DRAFT_255101 [Phyllosticta citrichinensis]